MLNQPSILPTQERFETMGKAIVTGCVSTEDQAVEWLKAQGATVNGCQAVTVIVLPERAMVNEDGYHWRYTITFYGPDGNSLETYVEVELNVDAYETVLRLKHEEEAPQA